MNERLCMNCMKKIDATIGEGEICPSCGFNNSTPVIKGALQYESRLQDRYVTGRVKCANSEGFTYVCYDELNCVNVDLREFFPPTLSYRDGTKVFPGEGKDAEFKSLFREFAEMARYLVKLRELSSIVSVLDIFYENNTAYIVYEHWDSVSLKSFVESNTMDWNTVRKLFVPMLSSLSSMHAFGIKHLGISPETLRICRDGKMRLSEFSSESVRREGSPIEPDLISGYAAYEQYTGNLECNEITDVYGFSASMFYAMTGITPADAAIRAKDQRLLISKEKLKLFPPNVISAVANGLQVYQENRTGSFEGLRAELVSTPAVIREVEEATAIKSLPKTYQDIPRSRGLSPKVWLAGSFILTALILMGIAYYVLNYTDFSVNKIAKDFGDANQVSALEVVTVPKMVGERYSDWVNKLKETNVYKFTVKVSSQEFSEDVKEGYIISQTPAAGETVEKNGEVSIVVSRGSTERTLPVINGIKFTDALEKLEAEGFEVVKEEVYDNKTAAGNVIWYLDYNSGDVLPYGTSITVVVSMGKEPKA